MKISNIYIGKEELFIKEDISFPTSYRKKEFLEDIFVSNLGFREDNQSDKKYHGGKEQALCVFCKEEYDFLNSTYKLDLKDCSFGENITLLDIKDEDICIGDVFKCGEARLEVSLPRVPCHKISDITGVENLKEILEKECITGFYLRILKEGFINKTFDFKLVERKNPKYTIKFVNDCLFNPKENQENIQDLLKCEQLASNFKDLLKGKLC